MHNLKPNTAYILATITIAVPANQDWAVTADGLNEMLRPAMMEEDAVFHDYSLTLNGPVTGTGKEPEEGELFNQ